MINNDADNATLTLKNDYLFKAVYGSDDDDSKYILKSLLNKILDRTDNPIVDIEYKNPFQAKLYVDDKETILDIKAIADSNEIIDIEMQIIWDRNMPLRLIYYHGGMLRDALKQGQDYGKIMPTVTICITNSIAFHETDNYLNEFYFIENDQHFKLTDKTKICCIELPKVNPDNKPVDELCPLEICLEYLRCAGENNSEYTANLIRIGGKDLKMTQDKFHKVTQDELLREQALAREKYQRDMLNWSTLLEEAEAKSALADEKLKKAISLLKKSGFSIEQISNTLALTIEEINNLQK